MLKKLSLCCLNLYFSLAFGQVFMNGDFEINTAGVDQINLGSVAFDGFMSNCYSFGTLPNIDIITSSTWGPPQNGNWFVSLTGGGSDHLVLELTSPMIAGNTYNFTFYDRKDPGYNALPIDIGLSATNNAFGTLIATTPTATNGVWTQRTVSFVAPTNGQYIVLRQQGTTSDWVHVDNFSMSSCAFFLDLGNDTTICDGGQLVLNANQGINATYAWSDNSTQPTNTITQTGTYWVEVTVDTCVASDTISVSFADSPTAGFTYTGNCLYDSINFVSTSTVNNGTITNLSWDFGDSNNGSDSLENHLYNAIGNYTVSLTALSSNGCLNTFSQTVDVNPIPVSSFTGLDTCYGSNFIFNNLSSISQGNIINYEWDFGDNTNSTLNTPTHNYQAPGNYTVELIVTSDSGCVDTSTAILLSHPEPEASFSFVTSCFLTDFTNLSTTPTGTITNYDWSFGDTNTDNQLNPSHTYSGNGTYTTNLSVTNNFGCVDDTNIVINISSNFNANFTSDLTSICSGHCISFSNTSIAQPGQSTFLWEFSDGQSSTLEQPIICFDNSTEQNENIDVFFKIITSNGCIDSVLMPQFIEVIPIPDPYFTYSPDSIPVSDPLVFFTNESLAADVYQWSFGDGSSSQVTNPEHNYPEAAKSYAVSLTAFDLTESCSATYSTTINIIDEIVFYVPNAFTPGVTGPNSTFNPVVKSGVEPYDYHLTIFNKWGEIIFESYDYSIGWDGTYGGNTVPNGVYIWRIDFRETMSDKHHVEIGHLTTLK